MLLRNFLFLTSSRNFISLTRCYSTNSVPQDEVKISDEKQVLFFFFIII